MCREHIVTALEKVGGRSGGGRIVKSLRKVPADETTQQSVTRCDPSRTLGAYPRLSLGRCRCGPACILEAHPRLALGRCGCGPVAATSVTRGISSALLGCNLASTAWKGKPKRQEDSGKQ